MLGRTRKNRYNLRMSNIYHLLHFIPATEAYEMPPALEVAARQLVASGKLRINADFTRNFVRHGTADSDRTFSARELSDPALLPQTRAALARHVPGALGEAGVDELIARLKLELVKARGVAPEKELKVARVLVQSAHPAVVQLLLESGAEVFVSYSHNVGDLMALHFWQTHGTASGLQSTGDDGTAVYVSCCGDPFFEGTDKTYTTDGWPALARMVVIAAQELGHFADLKREGKFITGRYSTDRNSRSLRADAAMRAARLSDMARVDTLQQKYFAAGLARLRKAEQGVAFYDARMRFTPPWIFHQCTRFLFWLRFVLNCKRAGIFFPLRTFPATRGGEAATLFLADMAFNLAPNAEVYRRPDPAEEEAIAVIEALARVPQQVAKWGHKAVKFTWPGLYAAYYGQVMAGVQNGLELPPPSNNISKIQHVAAVLRRAVAAKPAYFPGR